MLPTDLYWLIAVLSTAWGLGQIVSALLLYWLSRAEQRSITQSLYHPLTDEKRAYYVQQFTRRLAGG